MIHPLRLVIGLVACLALASALPALFSPGKITTYRYHAEIKSETFYPTSFASQLAISGRMYVTPEISNPNLKNAFYVYLDVTHGVKNGKIDLQEKIVGDRLKPIPDAAKALKDPFVAVFHDDGKVKDVIVKANEPGWAKNMKKSIASMLQLDLSSTVLQTPVGPHTFSTNESTIYGDCTVDYNINSEPELGAKMFIVTKSMEPMKCTKFNQHTFNSEESVDCFGEKQDNIGTSSKKIYHIENNGEYLLIKKLVAHGVMKYSPWKDGSGTHYILANQTMDFESSVPVSGITLPTLNMSEAVSLDGVTFQKPQSKYADKASVDLTYGRHVVNTEALITRLNETLVEAVDYMKENHWEMTELEIKHGQTMNRILDTMSLMDTQSLAEFFNRMSREDLLPNRISIGMIFLQMLPYVGTEATSLFIVSMIPRIIWIQGPPDILFMLAKLPFYVRAPTEELLLEMETMLNLGDRAEKEVKKVAILAFATLIHKALRYEKYHHPLNPDLVSRYVNHYFDHAMNETSYDMKIVYIQGLKNIGTRDVFRLLEPIVSGKVVLSEKPQYLRLMAMYAYDRADSSGVNLDDLFWPILENTESPLEIRTTALTILFNQAPELERFTRLVGLMEHEKNEHLYNYYYTTLESFANSSSSCLTPLKQIASNVLRDSRVRRPASADLLTVVRRDDYENEEFGFGESLTVNLVADQHTGTPFWSKVDYSSSDSWNTVNQMTLFLRVDGFHDIAAAMPWYTSLKNLRSPISKIENLLKRASDDIPSKEPDYFEFAIMNQGRFVMSVSAGKDSLPSMNALIMGLGMRIWADEDWQYTMFDKLYTKHVTNDLGLPTVFETKIPRVFLGGRHLKAQSERVNVELSAKYWSHGYQSMEVYNPIIDAWHAIRRVSAVDSSFPFAMTINRGIDTGGFTVTLPRLPITQSSVSYSRTVNKNFVMVVGADEDLLGLYCATCHPTEMVIKNDEHKLNKTLFNFESRDGLTLSIQQYGCDKNVSLGTGLHVFNKFRNNIDDLELEDLAVFGLMLFREYQLYVLTDAKIGSCGYLTKLEPSHVYPASEIDITIFAGGSTDLPKKFSMPPAINFEFNVSVVVKAETTKDPVRGWTVTGFWNSTEGYLSNELQLNVTQSSVGEENLKLCINAHKTYPPSVSDPFDRTVRSDSKTTGQLQVLFGRTVTDACPSEGLTLRIGMEGKVSDEQKGALEHGEIHNACQSDVENPLYMYAEGSVVPRTPACLREALLRTTLRQYVFDVFHQNVPENLMEMFSWVDDGSLSIMATNFTTLPLRTEPGNVKIDVEFPLATQGVNLNIRTSTHETRYTDFLSDEDEGWNVVLDNIYFSADLLNSIQDIDEKFCAIFPEVLTNADGATTPYTVPDKWTLVTGDYKKHLFAVFVKRIAPKKLGLLIGVTEHTIEIIPTDSNPKVLVDGIPVSYRNGMIVPNIENKNEDDSLAYRITWSPNPKRFQIETMFPGFTVEWTERSISLVMSSILQGRVTGLCGRLDGSCKQQIGKVYSIDE